MAPNFVGDKDIDHMNITVLNGITLKVCFHSLRTGGSVLMKSLNGTLENKFFVNKSLKNFDHFRHISKLSSKPSKESNPVLPEQDQANSST